MQSELAKGISATRVIRAVFPAGSMTGAPKRRTIEIIDKLENGQRRGVYSGSIGYISVCGAAQQSVVIRTSVVIGGRAHVGAGGAIVHLSDPEDEWREVWLKLAGVWGAVEAFSE